MLREAKKSFKKSRTTLQPLEIENQGWIKTKFTQIVSNVKNTLKHHTSFKTNNNFK